MWTSKCVHLTLCVKSKILGILVFADVSVPTTV